jgi:hypothetical protein
LLLQRNNEAQERVVETLITGSSRSIVQAVERDLIANITTLRVLATAPSLLARDFAGFHERARVGLEGTGTYAYVLDEKMMSLLSTRQEYPSPPRPSADPEAGRRAIDTRDVVVSNLVFGSVSQRYVFNILMPVFAPGGGPLVLGINRDAETLAATLLADKLPDGWNVALLDGTGHVIAGSEGANKTGDKFTLLDTPREPGDREERALVRSDRAGAPTGGRRRHRRAGSRRRALGDRPTGFIRTRQRTR